MSQPYLPPAPPAASGPASRPPAAPTQIAFPGQAPLAPQPRYAPPPEQPQQFAVGFPNYVSPPPSPANRTGLIVGSLAVALVVLFAVVGFALVA